MCRRLFVKVDPVIVLLCGQNDGPVFGVPLAHLVGNTVMDVDFHCVGFRPDGVFGLLLMLPLIFLQVFSCACINLFVAPPALFTAEGVWAPSSAGA